MVGSPLLSSQRLRCEKTLAARSQQGHNNRLCKMPSLNDPGWSIGDHMRLVGDSFDSGEEDAMWREPDAGGVVVHRLGRRAARPKAIRARPPTCWDEVLTMPVEVTTPDRDSASALLS